MDIDEEILVDRILMKKSLWILNTEERERFGENPDPK